MIQYLEHNILDVRKALVITTSKEIFAYLYQIIARLNRIPSRQKKHHPSFIRVFGYPRAKRKNPV
jgi:hypothetical protein